MRNSAEEETAAVPDRWIFSIMFLRKSIKYFSEWPNFLCLIKCARCFFIQSCHSKWKTVSCSHLQSRLQFSVRDHYTIIARADWKHMVTGLTLTLFPMDVWAQLESQVQANLSGAFKMPPKLSSDQANRGWKAWHPGFRLPLRGGRFFSFCRYFQHLTRRKW